MDFVSFGTWLDRRSHTGERWVVCGWASPQLTREEGWSRAGSVPTPFAEPPTRRRHSAARAEGLGSGANRVCHAVTPTRSWPISIERGRTEPTLPRYAGSPSTIGGNGRSAPHDS